MLLNSLTGVKGFGPAGLLGKCGKPIFKIGAKTYRKHARSIRLLYMYSKPSCLIAFMLPCEWFSNYIDVHAY